MNDEILSRIQGLEQRLHAQPDSRAIRERLLGSDELEGWLLQVERHEPPALPDD
jgi:hypothetical protein